MTLYTESLSDSISISDSLSTKRTANASVSDSVSASDSLSPSPKRIVDVDLTYSRHLLEPTDPATDKAMGRGACVIDSTTVAIGAGWHPYGGANNNGAVYIFQKQSDDSWSQIQKISNVASSECFGFCLSSSGDRLLIGAPGYDGDRGRAYVFKRVSNSYSIEDTIHAVAETYPGYAFAFAVCIDGDSAVISCLKHSTGGAVAVYTRSGSVWSQQGSTIAAPVTQSDGLFGTSVSIRGDVMAVGQMYYDRPGIVEAGAVYTYTRSGSTWTVDTRIIDTDTPAASDLFGEGLGLHGDTLVTSARKTFGGYTRRGKLYAYKNSLCVNFGGTNEYTTAGNVLAFEYNEPFSISVWFKGETDGYLISKLSSTPAGYGILLDTSGIIRLYLISVDGTSKRIEVRTQSTGWDNGEWHHVVAAYDGGGAASDVTIYIDGQSQSLTLTSSTLASTSIVTTQVINHACRTSGASGVWTGALSSSAIYSAELTSDDVTDIYEAGRSGDLSSLDSSGDLDAWWKMGPGDTFSTLEDSSGNNYDATMTNMESGDIAESWEPTPFQIIEGYPQDNNQLRIEAPNGDVFDGDYLVAAARGTVISERQSHLYEWDGTEFSPKEIFGADDAAVGDYFAKAQTGVGHGLLVVGAYGWDDATYDDSGAGYVFGYLGEIINILDAVEAQHSCTTALADSTSVSDLLGVKKTAIADFSDWADRITADDRAISDYFGCSVSVSGDFVAVGAYGDDTAGSVYIFYKDQQLAKISGSRAGENFGWSVALDGDTLAVGAPSYNSTKEGRVYVYTGGGHSWSLQDTINNPDTATAADFGFAIALCDDTILASAHRHNKVYTYERSGGSWSIDETFTNATSEFAKSVAIHNNHAVMGTGAGNKVFTSRRLSDGGSWSAISELSAPTGADNFGAAVCVIEDTLVVADPGYDYDGRPSDSGAVFFYTYSSGWSIDSGDTVYGTYTDNRLGHNGNLAFDGTFLVIGTYVGDSNGIPNEAYLYSKETGTWRFKQTLEGRAVDNWDWFSGTNRGVGVGGGQLAVVGAPHDDATEYNCGSITIYNVKTDIIHILDSVVASVQAISSLADSISLSDSVEATITHAVNLSDSISVSDSIAQTHVYSVALADSVSVSDSIAAEAKFTHIVELSDSVSVSDSVAAAQSMSVSLVDAISIIDVLTIDGAPNFGGIINATALNATTVRCEWNPAQDDLTPQAAIEYDVSVSETPAQSFIIWDVSDPGALYHDVAGLTPERQYYFMVRARDQQGNRDSNTIEATEILPPATNEAPIVSNWTPAAGATVTSESPIGFDVTDDSGVFTRIIVTVHFRATGLVEVVHNGDGFTPWYSSLSSRTQITNGYQYSIRRAGGWRGSPDFTVYAIDRQGNESVT